MAITTPCYCTREDVKSALDFKETARSDAQVDRAIEAASRSVEGLLNRRFYVWTGTRYFDWPDFYQRSVPWRLWLDENELISVTTLLSGGVAIGTSGYYLEPANSGPPYRSIEINRSSNSAFSSGTTPQRSIAITGVFGYSNDVSPAGTLVEALDASETGVDVSNSVSAGVGDVLLVDSERMLVTGKSMLDTGQTIAVGGIASDRAVVTVTVADVTQFTVGEVILIGNERMLVVDLSGTHLTVKRAWDGTILASHIQSEVIYAPRTLTVTRGALGTTAATHTNGTSISKQVVPSLVRELAIAESINFLQQEIGGWSRTTGSGANSQDASGGGLDAIRCQAVDAYGRRFRSRAV